MTERVGERFDRLPATAADRAVPDRPTREDVLAWWDERFGIDPSVFETYSFWERGAGKIWTFRGTAPDPIAVEGLGMTVLRTGGRHWKPTTNAVQRFGIHAARNVLELDRARAERFVAGGDQRIAWSGDRGYVIVATPIAETRAPLGVGLYVDGELRSTVPKGRQRTIRSGMERG